jgi:hypothetical protein
MTINIDIILCPSIIRHSPPIYKATYRNRTVWRASIPAAYESLVASVVTAETRG